jgi:hypothetical protein
MADIKYKDLESTNTPFSKFRAALKEGWVTAEAQHTEDLEGNLMPQFKRRNFYDT